MTDLPAGVSDDDVMRVANAIMMTFAKKWFLGSYKGSVYFDCINGEMAWLDEARAALTAALAGRVVVPREPTQAMINAADTEDQVFTLSVNSIEGIWRAMIAAAADGET